MGNCHFNLLLGLRLKLNLSFRMFTTKSNRGSNENCVLGTGDWTPGSRPLKCFVLHITILTPSQPVSFEQVTNFIYSVTIFISLWNSLASLNILPHKTLKGIFPLKRHEDHLVSFTVLFMYEIGRTFHTFRLRLQKNS